MLCDEINKKHNSSQLLHCRPFRILLPKCVQPKCNLPCLQPIVFCLGPEHSSSSCLQLPTLWWHCYNILPLSCPTICNSWNILKYFTQNHSLAASNPIVQKSEPTHIQLFSFCLSWNSHVAVLRFWHTH